jgi:hypothetical protein
LAYGDIPAVSSEVKYLSWKIKGCHGCDLICPATPSNRVPVGIVPSGPVLDGTVTPSGGPVLDGPSPLWDILHDCWRIERVTSPSP